MSIRAPRISVLTCLPLLAVLSVGCGGDNGDPAAKPADDGKADDGAKAASGEKAGGGDAKAEGGDAKAEAGDAKAEGGDAKAGGHVGGISDEDVERLKLMGADVAKHLATANTAVASGDWEAAAQAYGEALKLDDDNPHILAAMGWAEFNNKKLDNAEHLLRQALRYERDGDRRADVLYKLGRVDEERGDWAAAKEHYDHSLRLKDNAEAKEHDDLATAKAAEACKDGSCDKPDYKDLAEACDAMVKRVHRQLGLPEGTAGDEFTCSPDKAQKVKLEGGDATEAVILKVSGEHGVVEEEEYDLLAHIEGGWHWIGTVLDIENPHHDGILRSGKLISFEAHELMPETPGTELLLKVELSESDADLDENLIYHDEHEAYIVCGVSKNTHVCHEIPTKMLWEAEAIDSTRETAHDTATHQFSAKAEFDGKGNVTVTGTGEIPEAEKGTHKISELPEPHGFIFLHED